MASRVVGKPFKPGQSGNPSGRPKSNLGERIRKATKDGEELVDFAMRIFNDKSQKMDHRMEAHRWLADRGWGKAATQVTLSADADQVVSLLDLIAMGKNGQEKRETVAG